ncbi:hypothetical protein pben1_p13 [Paracoccus phage vB_PbeS_Pben1]|uniref:Uncharacterized protein n=1 Tax=Paracoccus versutus TaxID=34007 RepID=A0A3D9XPB6_PARVE|nr:hypothetical protein [Paracoccus versutus]AZV00170.1 hypothetical protein pben1_p13 [Paracoccus phage vB_PbeS_Pben1]REF72287.1 hypothetical protein BDD41_0756 [Paracoccus versutus]WGR55729.1 hypothetical protein E3U25_07065 [Paracoccus versutus]
MARHELNFLEFIQGFRRGELLETGDQKLSELIEAIRETGNGGSLSMKVSIKVNKAGQLEVVPDITIKKPTRSMGTGIYFATDDGRLTRRDPNQMDFEDELERRRSSES